MYKNRNNYNKLIQIKNKIKTLLKKNKSIDKCRALGYNKANKRTEEKIKKRIAGSNSHTSNKNLSKGGTNHRKVNFSFVYKK